MITRYAISFTFAALITFGLFFGMQLLITTNEIKLDDSGPNVHVELGQVRDAQEVRQIENKPEVPQAAEAAPTTIDMSTAVENVTGGVEIAATAMVISTVSTGGTGGFSAADGEYLPIVRVAPQYPQRAAENGIEGYVIVEFTVTAEGTTDNVIAAESSHKMFERNAVKAAQKFKFKPRVADGNPISVDGVQNRIIFELAQ